MNNIVAFFKKTIGFFLLNFCMKKADIATPPQKKNTENVSDAKLL